jgi:hypothetical protein
MRGGLSLLLCRQSRNLNYRDVNNIVWELMYDVPLCLVPESLKHGVLHYIVADRPPSGVYASK